MKISTQHLDAVKGLLAKDNAQLADQVKVAVASAELRAQLEARVRGLQGAFDVCAAAYSVDGELSDAQLEQMPLPAQSALGYQDKAPHEE